MFLLLPLFFSVLCAFTARRYLAGWRTAVLFAAIIAAIAVTAITESLSLIQSLSFYPVMMSWLFLIVIAVLKCFNLKGCGPIYPKINFNGWFLSEKILLGMIVLIMVVGAITAAVGIPNTWDSMTYHLPRIEHWMQNKTVAYYPTNILRQLCYAPWAEFAIVHLRILGGGQTSANFIQWMAMAGSLVGVSLIAGQLGANRKAQLMASTIAACLPMGILESVSTQTDYAGTFWLIVFVFFLLETRREASTLNIIAAGLSLGLAFLTKGNAYIFAFPFLIWFIVANFNRQLGRVLVLILMCAVSLNIGQYVRNTKVFGSPTWTNVAVINSSFAPQILWVNTLRNMSIHLATPLPDVNATMTQMITKLAQFSGSDINDPRATFGDHFSISNLVLDEDYAGNFLHAVLFTVVILLAWFYRGPKREIVFYICTVTASFLLFCLIVRYQPFNSRFHLPLFVLFCPIAGLVLEHFLKRKSVLIGAVFFFGAMPWLFLNSQHPWIGNLSIWKQPKAVQYFYKRPYLALPYVQVAGYLKSINCRQIGLSIGENSWEYPWWGILADKDVRIEHVNVTNPSASLKYPLGDFQACAIVVSGVQAPPLIMTDNAVYTPVGSIPAGDDKVTIFLRKI